MSSFAQGFPKLNFLPVTVSLPSRTVLNSKQLYELAEVVVDMLDDLESTSTLSDEDHELIENFYKSAKSQELTGKQQQFHSSTDFPPSLIQPNHAISVGSNEITGKDGWSIDPQLNEGPSKYSPTLRLLTTFNPIGDGLSEHQTDNQIANPTASMYSGSTVVSGPDSNIKSKSAAKALQMHDELLKDPPRDGKVRVRMYHHRALHDDVRLYGTGPWKYWGHGWGVEYGYDPRDSDKKNSYQRGYAIERAFGRDFCKSKQNCRQPDPDFFKNPQDAGKYSMDIASNLKPH